MNGSRISTSAREALVCASLLGLLALAMSASHISSGGLYYDDWSLLALARFPSPGGLLHGLWLDYGQRPGQVLYYAALDEAFGMSAADRLALAAGALALEATCLFALLRELGLGRGHAFAIAVLVLVFPFSDSVWLWGVLSLGSVAIAAALLGLLLALRALRSDGRRALALHAASLSLFVASLASYEIFAVAGCFAGLLYVRAVGWRRARLRWAIDLVTVVATLAITRFVLPIDVATPSRTQSLAGMLDHAGLIGARGLRLAGAAALPVGGVAPWLGVGLLAAVVASAAMLRLRLPAEDPARADLGRWLAIAAAGALVAAVGWAVYVPGPDHYAPGTAGTVNRMNAGAAIGIAILLYATVVLLARSLVRLARLPAPAGTAGIAAVALVLAAGLLARSVGDARAWDTAAADQGRVLADLHAALPRLPAGATVFAFDAPWTAGQGVPVLNTTLDLTSAMRISYASARLLGVPLASARRLSCAARGPLAAGFAGAYGSSYLVDVDARSAVRIAARRSSGCSGGAPGPACATTSRTPAGLGYPKIVSPKRARCSATRSG